mmetsp:Transcript_17387/g.47477  ORF Transcript_17387/g.47477 Transcript_17387/m.47477 type:complete len:559 (-) Transcript_17387:64-1740(-)
MSTDQQRKNADIWSTRVQKELLALTTDNADAETTDEVRSMLPNFCKVKKHKLSIEKGDCAVLFDILASEGKVVTVSIDASLAKSADGKIDFEKPAYPFADPLVLLQAGEEFFPPGSTIKNGNRIGMDIDWTPSLHLTDAIMNVGLKVKESVKQGEPFHPAPAAGSGAGNMSRVASGLASVRSAFGNNKAAGAGAGGRPNRTKSMKKAKKTAAPMPGDVGIGDEINLLEEPWVNAHGVYSCKAIRRPAFVQQAMTTAAEKEEQDAFKSPSSMFRSFTQSAQRVLEESFLMITETHLIEVRASKLNMSTGKVCFAIPIDMMAKLKFRRQESVSLFFKPQPDDPLIYMCPDSGDAVHQIQAVLKRHGVKGKHTNAAAHRAINEALHLVQDIQTKELALKHDPTVERVNDIMDLYRQAAERFEVAGDIRHEEVVTHMRKFLALPLTTSILDGSYQKPESSIGLKKAISNDGTVPEGEVLERHDSVLDDHDEDGGVKVKDSSNDKEFEENIDNLLKEAQNLSLDDTETTAGDSTDEKSLADVAADLDAMMREADKELAELMNT